MKRPWEDLLATPTTSLTLHQALQILYKGQSNVKLMANDLGLTLEEMQEAFRDYVAATPIDEDVWRGDIELGWPWA